ncbi:related to cytochrome-c oxidase assembly protein [Ramularia collo-cygni]|uniref:Related to cytochrome-c oxidase assembly protein n=1 Tax=Ramularia collo-cygni TaxID=112498 RepID=A0A2D3V2A0_9PEZI|nr:related to cytochrome-c oxidase assembly protein [Ramularia collo-cygni]CZT18807.1 related to cytochrome-c oxidase assembly protein [Ramularia collo-cygni]
MSRARQILKIRAGGPNLEVAKFGMYIMFPIGFMYYFGINLDSRFAVPDFWPKKEQTHQIPFEREDIAAELEVLKAKRLAARARRLAIEAQGGSTEVTTHQDAERENPRPEILQATKVVSAEDGARKKGWLW